MARSRALKLASIDTLKGLKKSEGSKKKRELEVTDTEDDQQKRRRGSKQVHWDLAPMPPSSAYSASSAFGRSDLPKPSGLPQFVEPDLPDASCGKTPCKRQGSPAPWTTSMAFKQPRFHHSGTLCSCDPTAATWLPDMQLSSMPWLSSNHSYPTEPMTPLEDMPPAPGGSGWTATLPLLPTPWLVSENPQDMTANGANPVGPRGTDPQAVDVVQSQPVADANTPFAGRTPGTADVVPVNHPVHPDSGYTSPACCSYAGDYQVPQDAAAAQPADVRAAPMAADMSFSRPADPGTAYSYPSAYNYSYAYPSPAHPVGYNTPNTPPNSAVGPGLSPVMPAPVVSPTPVYQHPIERAPTHGYFPPPRPKGYFPTKIRPLYPAPPAWPAPPDASCDCPAQQAPHPYNWQYGMHWGPWAAAGY